MTRVHRDDDDGGDGTRVRTWIGVVIGPVCEPTTDGDQ